MGGTPLGGGRVACTSALAITCNSVERADYEHAVAAARTRLGEQAFATAWAEGRTMTIEQVLAELK